MVLRTYLIFLVVGIIGYVVYYILDTEAEEERNELFTRKKYLKVIETVLKVLDFLTIVFFVIFCIYNVFVIYYCITEKHFYFIYIPILFLCAVLFISINEHVKSFNFLTQAIGVICIGLWVFYTGIFSLLAIERPLNGENVTDHQDLVETINILEFKQAPYNSVTGGRYYVKSSPNSAYYYEVRTERGGTTTKCIDGSNSYVEKFESNEYIDNPHIEVYRTYTITQYTSWYGNEVTEEKNSRYMYYIYIPEDSTFYEE